jgi:hypothetical protein
VVLLCMGHMGFFGQSNNFVVDDAEKIVIAYSHVDGLA